MIKTELKNWMWKWLSPYADQYKFMDEFDEKLDEFQKPLPLKIERVIVVAAQKWGNDYPSSTVGIIGRDAIEICEEYGIDWENYK